MKGQCLGHSATFEAISLRPAALAATVLDSVSPTDNVYTQILAEFPDILNPSFTQPAPNMGGVPYSHHRTATPHTCMQASPDKLQLARDKFRQMEEMGIVCRSDSP